MADVAENVDMGEAPDAHSRDKVHHTVTACVRCRTVGLLALCFIVADHATAKDSM